MAIMPERSMMPSSLANAPAAAVLRAQNYERAKAFYTQTLGLEIVQDSSKTREFMVGAGQGTMIDVYERPGMPAPQNTTLGWAVPDIESTVQELRERGVKFEDYDIPEMGIKTVNGIAAYDGQRVAWFKDTEDNILMVGTM